MSELIGESAFACAAGSSGRNALLRDPGPHVQCSDLRESEDEFDLCYRLAGREFKKGKWAWRLATPDQERVPTCADADHDAKP